jgi:hypothetical protein
MQELNPQPVQIEENLTHMESTDREITLDHLRAVEADLLQHLGAVQHTIMLLTV